MAFILVIDTALSDACVGLSKDGQLLQFRQNSLPNDHAAFVQPAIREMLAAESLTINEIDAVGVVAGPGSYTGLRVGLASAKGICYALGKPLMLCNTLELLADSARIAHPGYDLFCPMIDARRDEVFTAVYKPDNEILQPPMPFILNPSAFGDFFEKKLLFIGNGAEKAKVILNKNPNWSFTNYQYTASDTSRVFFNLFINKQFRDLAYAEPFYLKDFYFQSSHKLT